MRGLIKEIRYLPMKVAQRDLVAIEAKYHFKRLTKYRNHCRSHVRSCASSSSEYEAVKRAKATAFAEIVSCYRKSLRRWDLRIVL